MIYSINGVDLIFGINVKCNGILYENYGSWLPRKSDYIKTFISLRIKGQNPDVAINVEDEEKELYPIIQDNGCRILNFFTNLTMRVATIDLKNGKKVIFLAFVTRMPDGKFIPYVRVDEKELATQLILRK